MVIKNIAPILQSFFDSTCDVIQFVETFDEFGITQLVKSVSLKNVPCRVCYSNIKPAIKGKSSDYITQEVTLLIPPDISIKNGSIINVTKNNQMVSYQKTGESAVYPSHKEIRMVINNTFA